MKVYTRYIHYLFTTAVMTTGLKEVNQRQYINNTHHALKDMAIIEEPLLISLSFFDVNTQQYRLAELTLIMRTPSNDTELITGFLFNEQIIQSANDIIEISVVDEDLNQNNIIVKLAQKIQPDWQHITRSFPSQSSCGVCGKTSLNALSIKTHNTLDNTSAWLSKESIIHFAQTLKTQQPLFNRTGSAHGAGYVVNNQWVCVYEDVGRHNAVDKVIGNILLNNVYATQSILVLSGRVSFELIQKAVVASIPVIVAIGAPSSLAISAAIQFNITLIGFTKPTQFNVYHGNHRICPETTSETT